MNIKKTMIAASICAGLSVSTASLAANNTGSLTGNVTDSASQVAISGATVLVTNSKTGFKKSLTTKADGTYRLGSLPIGTYDVTISYDGFNDIRVDTINVTIGAASSINVGLVSSNNTEVIEVRGSSLAIIDVSSSESALNISAEELEMIPVPRSISSVALLAPGTTGGDSRFGGVSFGGASVAENSTYINGLNVTNFRNGLGFSNVPYEFYDQFQVKTGGYSAEFGRSTGGVVNAVTKSGSNEFEFGASVYYQPEAFAENSPNVRANDGSWLSYRSDNTSSSLNANIYASGAIIEDTLFFFALYNPRNVESEYDSFETGGDRTPTSSDDAFWGAKIDWNITDNHRLEYLIFSDENERTTDVFVAGDDTATSNDTYTGSVFDRSGGQNWSITYTGYITDDLTISALYGENTYDLTSDSTSAQECQLVLDYRYYYGSESTIPLGGEPNAGCATTSNYFIESGEDTRKAMRFDVEWQVFDNHLLRFGMDNEINSSISQQSYSGPEGAYWISWPAAAGEVVNGVTLPTGTDYIRNRIRTVGGTFETEASAFYVEDTWDITDSLTATIGIRNEQFDNKNGEGSTFVEVKDMWAPRLGLSWDINGDGDSKAFVNVGRYFLPVANNTNVRLAGNEKDVRQYYELGGWSAQDYNGIAYNDPILGAQIGTDEILSDGSVPDTTAIVDADLNPMYQDEIIIGYQAMIDEQWSWGIKGTHRELVGAIDDMIIDHAIASKFGCTDYHASQYVLGNPGEDMRVFSDTDCDKQVDSWVDFTAEELVYDEAERTYYAVDLTVGKQWDGIWSINATYTWSKSFGNSEGLVKSDNGQGDAGLTTDFDFPELMDGAHGYLPNDRRHMFKLYGTVGLPVLEGLTAGYNFTLESGRPINAFGLGHPNVGEVDYGSTYYLTELIEDADGVVIDQEYTKVSRGSMGRTPWVARLDLNLMYQTELMGADTMFKIDVFNILNAESHTRVDEDAESTWGNVNDRTYGRPVSFQTPRYVQLSASVKF
jgi:hypothetical protein